MGKSYFSNKIVEPPGVTRYSERSTEGLKPLKGEIQNSFKRAINKLPVLIDQSVETLKDWLQSKHISNKNTTVDTLSKLSKIELDHAEYYKVIAEAKKLEREAESIEIQNRSKELEFKSVLRASDILKSQNIPHYVNEGKIILLNEGDKK